MPRRHPVICVANIRDPGNEAANVDSVCTLMTKRCSLDPRFRVDDGGVRERNDVGGKENDDVSIEKRKEK